MISRIACGLLVLLAAGCTLADRRVSETHPTPVATQAGVGPSRGSATPRATRTRRPHWAAVTRAPATEEATPRPTWTPTSTLAPTQEVETFSFPEWVLASSGGADEGPELDLDEARNLLFVAPGPNLYVYDVADPAQPRLLGQTSLVSGNRCYDMAVVRSHVYISCVQDVGDPLEADLARQAAIFIVDASNAARPRVVGSTRVFAPTGANGLQDQSSVALKLERWKGALLVGTSETRQAAVGWIASGGHLVALDLADPKRPTVAWDVDVGGTVRYVAEVADAIALKFETSISDYMSATDDQIGLVQQLAANDAEMTDQINLDGLILDLAGIGNHAYSFVLSGEDDALTTLHVYDSAGSKSIEQGASMPYPSAGFGGTPEYEVDNYFPHRAEARDNVLAVREHFDSADRMEEGINLPLQDVALRLYDIGDPSLPLEQSWLELPLTGSWGDLVLGSRTAFVSADQVAVVSMADPEHPRVASTFQVPSLPGVPVRAVEDNHVAVGDRLVDVSEPLEPVAAAPGSGGIHARGPTGPYASGTPSETVSFFADRPFGLRVNEVGSDGSISELGALETSGRALEVKVVDDLAYIAHTGPNTKGSRFQMDDPARWIMVADVADPAHPRLVADLSMEALAQAAGAPTDGSTAATAWAASRDVLAIAIRPELYHQDDFIAVLPARPSDHPPVVRSDGFGPIGSVALDGCTLYVRQGEGIAYTFAGYGGPLFITDICDDGREQAGAGAEGSGPAASALLPEVLSELPLASGSPGRLVPDGDRLYVTDDLGLLEIDVSDRADPKPVRMLAGVPINGVVRLGDYLFMGGGSLGLLVADARSGDR